MKNILKLSLVAGTALLTTTVVSAQSKTDHPQPTPMSAPAVNLQHQQNGQNAVKQETQKTTTTTTTAPKSTPQENKKDTPPVDNKIAVSDPGMPADKKSTTNSKLPPPQTQPSKSTNVKKENGVSPK